MSGNFKPQRPAHSTPPAPGRRSAHRSRLSAFLHSGCLLGLAAATLAHAGGPRYVTGPPFFTGPAGQPIGWRQSALLYSTDPGDLGPAVNHAAADALVAAAAGIWNVPVASISLNQGGELAEHVSSANAYLSSTAMEWPADVTVANAAQIPVAIIYDTDGSITDTLLGSGASEPAGCRQNAVTESVDAFDPAGYILHAIIVLNGRCSGPAPEQQLQMQYQLERVFGRVLGLAWSQTNDNVFTGTPAPTYNQASHWPIMHPIDIVCGPYTYQCLPNPFTLRPDDIAGLVAIYPIPSGTTPASGKQVSLLAASAQNGFVTFPDGEGMTGMNVLMQRRETFTASPEGWFETSAISGSGFRRSATSPFVPADTSPAGSMGTPLQNFRGFYSVAYFAETEALPYEDQITSTEPLNPLYIGAASLGPYQAGIVAPAGSLPLPFPTGQVSAGELVGRNFAIADAPSACGSGTDGTPAEPMPTPPAGWWQGLLCGYGHASYTSLNVPPGRSLTVEVTALDAHGFATLTKAMPVIGLFAPADAVGSLPSLAVAPSAFNALSVGTTTLTATPFAPGGPGGVIRVGIADQRGDGRPDFAYQARVFYAESVTPQVIPAAGATLTIAGMGFRPGNQVLVNGIPAGVTNSSKTTITATAPTLTGSGAPAGQPLDVEVVDLGTGATSTISGALTYDVAAQLPNSMRLVSAPAGPVFVGAAATPAFTVQVVKSDGLTPVPGETIVFSTTTGAAQFNACAAAVCSVSTDVNGIASAVITPAAAGPLTLQAMDGALQLTVSLGAQPQPGSLRLLSAPSGTVDAGAVLSTTFSVQALAVDGHTPLSGQLVTFSSSGATSNGAPPAAFAGCNASPCSVLTDNSGRASVAVIPTSPGAIVLLATDGPASAQASLNVIAPPDEFTLVQAPRPTSFVGQSAGTMGVHLTLPDGATPLQYVPVVFTAPSGIELTACASNRCTVNTDYFGGATTQVVGLTAGTFTVTATFGALTQSVTLIVTVPQSTLSLVSVPVQSVPVGTQASTPLGARLLDGYGRPVAGSLVSLGGAQDSVLMGCGTGSCLLTTDQNGLVTSPVTPLKAGVLEVEAVSGNLIAVSSLTATGGTETLTVVSPPPATVIAGVTSGFKLLLMAPDGITPEAGHIVWLTATRGSWTVTPHVNGCTGDPCKFLTAADGTLTVTGAGYVPGPVTLTLQADGLTQTVAFTVLAPSYTMRLVSAPSGSFPWGASIAPAFTVQVLQADGISGAPGQNVTFAQPAGSVSLAACVTLPCVVVTDANGMATSGTIGATSPGPVTLIASDNAMRQNASFTITPPDVRTVTANPAQSFLAEGATVNIPLSLQAEDNGAPAAAQPIIWSGGQAFTVTPAASVTSPAGTASAQGTVGPLPAGASTAATACLWGNVCATWTAFGVSAGAWQITILSGANQSVSGGATPLPLVVEVTDAAGHPVDGVPVTVGQTVRALDGSCPAQGRCPTGAVLGSSEQTITSDATGCFSVAPLRVAGRATMTALAFSAGLNGFATTQVASRP